MRQALLPYSSYGSSIADVGRRVAAFDADLALYNLFGVGGTPTIVVIDSDRTVRYRSSQLPRSWASL